MFIFVLANLIRRIKRYIYIYIYIYLQKINDIFSEFVILDMITMIDVLMMWLSNRYVCRAPLYMLLTRLQRFYRITMSLKIPFVPRSDVQQ